MDVERRTVVELAVAVLGLVVFTGGAYVVSSAYAAPRNATTNATVPPSIEPTGGIALVGVIALFIVVVAAAGLLVHRQDLEE